MDEELNALHDEVDEMMNEFGRTRQHYNKEQQDKMLQVITDYWQLKTDIIKIERENKAHMEEMRNYYFRH